MLRRIKGCDTHAHSYWTYIQREKTLKHYVREWKINLIEHTIPHWADLYPTLPGVAPVPKLVPRGTLGPRDKPEDDT